MLSSLTLLAALACPGCKSVISPTPGSGSGTVTSGNRLLAYFTRSGGKPSAAAQPDQKTSLFTKKTKAGADLFVTMAQLREQAGDNAEAEKLYQKALKADSKSLPALMGYAHLEDRRGRLESATKLYQRAVAKHPNEAAPHNDLGLCYHRRGMLRESVRTLERAVEIDPDRKLYHNNLAMVLVDYNRNSLALKQLLATSPPATAHYNLAYLLYRKGDEVAALEQFRFALAADPSMRSAEQWIAKLDRPGLRTGQESRIAGLANRSPVASPAAPASYGGQSSTATIGQVVIRPASSPEPQSKPDTNTVSATTAVSAPNGALPQFLYADESPVAPATGAVAAQEAEFHRVQYPGRHEDSAQATGATPPLPGDDSVISPAPSAEEAAQPSEATEPTAETRMYLH